MGSSSVSLFLARPGAGTGAPPAMTVSQPVSDRKDAQSGQKLADGIEFGVSREYAFSVLKGGTCYGCKSHTATRIVS